MSLCVVGVDLGGTNVRACAYLEDGTAVSERISNPSNAQDGTPAILRSIADTVRSVSDSASVRPTAIGLAIPGHVDTDRGVVIWAPNFGETRDGIFYNWVDVAVGEPLEKQIGMPVFCGNDANLAAIGEYRFGSGRNEAKCLVLLTIGTGIGGGVIMRPTSLHGDVRGPVMLLGGNQGGAELGHTIIMHGGLDCNAGSYGAIEGFCQRDSIVKRAVHRLNRGRESSLRDLVGGDYSKVTPQLIAAAAEKGDEMSIEVWSEVGSWLGVGIGSLINVFAPDVFAIGGQIAKAGELMLGPARTAARNCAIPSLYKDAKIVQAEQIDDAGVLGGAAFALETLKWKTA